MADPILKLKFLVRAELALAEIHTRRTVTRSAFFSVALVFILLGLAMMTLAAFHGLTPYVGDAWAAFIVSIVDTTIGIIVLLMARRAGPSENEEKLAREVREMAYAELNNDIQQVRNDLGNITREVGKMRSSVTALTNGTIGTLRPIISLLIKAAKKPKTQD
mgnify:FL=1